MFTYDFMQNAFAAAGIVAVVSGLIGFFLVLRAQTFAGHALSHVGFAGATGAVLFGLPAAMGPDRADVCSPVWEWDCWARGYTNAMSPSASCWPCRWDLDCCS